MANAEGAFLLWARDWLTDERLVLMSATAKGCYIDLLCHCWLEGSVPACSEHLARIARIDSAAFAAVWRELGVHFVPHPVLTDRLVNRRMEEERAKSEERRKARQDKAKRAAEARWGRRDGHQVAPKSDARRNARSIPRASTVALPGDAHQSNPSTEPPFPPSGKGQPAAEPRSQSPEPETENRQPAEAGAQPDAPSMRDDAVQLEEALLRTDYRNRVPGLKRRFVIAAAARELVQTGMRAEHVPELLRLAQRGQDPSGLLAHWLDGKAWRSVIDEDAMKGRQAGLIASRPEPDESLRGIYGDDPMPARDLVGVVLARAGA